MTTVYVGMGSNVGDRVAALHEALDQLRAEPGLSVSGVSSFYESEPLEYPDQTWFVNAVVRLETDLAPLDLLDRLQGIEKHLQQQRRSIRWGPRTIDLDVLLYGDELVAEPRLQIPHVRLHDRAFVLVPLAELDPDARHPVLNQTARELLAQLPRKTTVNKLEGAR